MNSEGYFRFVANPGWTLKSWWVVRYWVWWATGWSISAVGSNCLGTDWEHSCWGIGWWLDGMSPVEMGCTRGYPSCTRRCTLGAGDLTGVAAGTLGACWFSFDGVWHGGSVVELGAAVSPAQCSRVSWRALMDFSCSSTVDAGVSLRTSVSCCTPCRPLFYGVTDGRVSLWFLNSMVSDTISALVSLYTTIWHRYWSIAAPTHHPSFPLKSH